MNAKSFLLQMKKLDKMIENKMVEKEQWIDIAQGTTAMLGSERVQSSGSQQKMADAVERFIEIENEIDECIGKLIEAKKDVISVIEMLDVVEYDFLHKVYVQYIDLKEVAVMLGKKYTWATTTHGRALQNVQRILDERERDG